MRKYRIKEIEGMFIPQARNWFIWEGICHLFGQWQYWNIEEYQIKYCAVKTLEEARAIILSYQISILNKKPKYHKA